MSRMKFYSLSRPDLHFFVRHCWSVNTQVGESPTLLLPMDHVDLILCPPGTFAYGSGEQLTVPKGFHFHGVRQRSISVWALKEAWVWGVSFQPWGFQAIAGRPMKSLTDQILLLQDHHPEITAKISEAMGKHDSAKALVAELDEVFGAFLEPSGQEMEHLKLIAGFIEAFPENIQAHCELAGISRRHLERLFNHYVGVSPKKYRKIRQFERSCRELLYADQMKDLTRVGFESGYYDQSHFIRHFKEHTNYTPRRFREKRPALKSRLFVRE